MNQEDRNVELFAEGEVSLVLLLDVWCCVTENPHSVTVSVFTCHQSDGEELPKTSDSDDDDSLQDGGITPAAGDDESKTLSVARVSENVSMETTLEQDRGEEWLSNNVIVQYWKGQGQSECRGQHTSSNLLKDWYEVPLASPPPQPLLLLSFVPFSVFFFLPPVSFSLNVYTSYNMCLYYSKDWLNGPNADFLEY